MFEKSVGHYTLISEHMFEHMLRMFMTHVGEAVAVLVDQGGAPIRFRWREKNYQVSSKAVRWYARSEWWVGERAHRGIGSSAVEVEIWRFLATGEGTDFPFVLLHNVAANSWKLLRRLE